MPLFYCPGVVDGEHFLTEEEARHCAKVLRKKTGDTIQLTDGQGHFYRARLGEVSGKQCRFNIIESTSQSKSTHRIHIAIAPTKNIDRTEWFVEKAVEIGIDEISFLNTAHSERKKINLDRIIKKAISAMKQSVRCFLPKIQDITSVKAFLEHHNAGYKFIAHLDEGAPVYLQEAAIPSKDYLILIGPEGGFSPEEINLARQHGYKNVCLGDYRLRTETAGVVAATILNTINLR